MTRYVGTGDGIWQAGGAAYLYRPSSEDVAQAIIVAADVEKRRKMLSRRAGYGKPGSGRASWEIRGILGEIAALRPLGSGPDLDGWLGRGAWAHRSDHGALEIRTTSTYQLYGFALKPGRPPGLGGWRVTAKDLGRYIVCVQDRETEPRELVVHGYAEARKIARLPVPLDAIIGVIEPPELRPLIELADYAAAYRSAIAV